MNGNIPDTFWTTQEELLLFGGSCLLGLPAGVLFDGWRLLRRLVPPRNAVILAVQDLLWLLEICVLLLCYASVFDKGVFRGYFAIGCLIGFVLYECTLGRLVVAALERILKLLWKPVHRTGLWFARIYNKGKKIFVKFTEKVKNEQKNTQNRLQKPMKKVYNKSSSRKKGNANAKKSKKAG